MKESTPYADWIETFIRVARHFRLEYSEENISLAANWSGQQPLSDILRTIARQAGLTLKVIKLKEKHLNAWHLPLVVQFKQGQIGVIETVDAQGNIGICFADNGGATSAISRAELLDNVELALVLRPAHGVPDARIDDYIKPHDPNWFKKLVLRDWKPYAHIFLASFLVNILALGGILFTRQVYDRVIPAESYPTLYVLFTGVMIAIVFAFILRKLRTRITDLLGKRADLRISDRVFGHALRIKSAFRPKSTGTFISQIRELDSVRELLTSTTVIAFADMPFFIVFCFVFWYLAGVLVWIPIIAVLLMVLPGLLAQKRLHHYANLNMRENSLRNAILVEAIQGGEDIKLLQAEQLFQKQWNNYNAVAADINLKLRSLTSTLTTWTNTVQTSTFAVIVLFGTPMVINGDLTTGSLIAASILGGRMIAPMAGLTQVLVRWQQAKVALNGINQLMSLPVDNPIHEKRVHKSLLNGNYELKNATFFYGENNDQLALHVKHLTINAGERIALLGRNGSGKSTLLQALSGLLEPNAGSIMLDDISLSHIDPADRARDIGFMSQQSTLFHGTIRDNLVLGAPTASDADIFEAVKISGALEFIQKSPLGLDYVITEGGLGLSGGQQKSLLLARTLLRHPQIILLDEPAASLDDVTEQSFVEQLDRLLTNQTLVVATHKKNVLRLVNRIIVVSNGKIVLDEPKDIALATLSGKQTP